MFLKKNNPLFMRFECQIIRFLLPTSDLDLASTEASFNTIALEVIESTLCVDTVREKNKDMVCFGRFYITLQGRFYTDVRYKSRTLFILN